MPSLAILTIIGVLVLAVLVVWFLKQRQRDLISAFVEKRRPTAKIVSRADYVEGAEKIPVALCVSGDTLYYENPDLEASFDLNRIDEVEYSEELSTGKNHDPDTRVLRLRSHGTTFEFLIDKNEAAKWQAVLPPRTIGASVAHAV
jgi:hypothetical protein